MFANHRSLLIAMSTRAPRLRCCTPARRGRLGGSARRAWRVVPSGESGRSPGWREEPRAGAADRDRLDRSRRARVARGGTQCGGAMACERRAEEVAERAVRRVDPGAGARRVRFDVRGGVGAGGVETGIGPGGGSRERELQQCRQQPEHAQSFHATWTFRAAHATTSSSPYMQTINGPVGRSALYETHKPSEEASAPEAHEM